MTLSPKLKGVLALLVVFLLGGVVGAGVTHAQARHRGDRGESFEHRRLDAMTRRLGLDDAERQKVGAILDKHRDETRRLTREMFDSCGASLKTEREQADAEIRAVLRPDQQAAYDALLKEQRERFFGKQQH